MFYMPMFGSHYHSPGKYSSVAAFEVFVLDCQILRFSRDPIFVVVTTCKNTMIPWAIEMTHEFIDSFCFPHKMCLLSFCRQISSPCLVLPTPIRSCSRAIRVNSPLLLVDPLRVKKTLISRPPSTTEQIKRK